jgi:hypothetical protein
MEAAKAQTWAVEPQEKNVCMYVFLRISGFRCLMTFLLFFAWYYVIRKDFKIEKISPQGAVDRW